VQLVALDGARFVAPALTKEALELAVRQGADGLSVPVRRTLDGIWVVWDEAWILRSLGASIRPEAQLFSELRQMDLGELYGPFGSGQSVVSLEELIGFARANGVFLILRSADPSADPLIRQAVSDLGGLDVVRQESTLPLPIPGNDQAITPVESPLLAAEAARSVGAEARSLVVGDARSWARALGRNPGSRDFVPIRLEAARTTRGIRATVASTDPAARARAYRSLTLTPNRRELPLLLDRAVNESDPDARLSAVFALGSYPLPESLQLLSRIARRADPPNPSRERPFPYFMRTYRLTAICALVAHRTPDSRAELEAFMKGSPAQSEMVAHALATLGDRATIPLQSRIVQSGSERAAALVVRFASRWGDEALPIYLLALGRQGEARKLAIFRMSMAGRAALPAMASVANEPDKSAAAGAVREWLALGTASE
jgi:hypothetical protein